MRRVCSHFLMPTLLALVSTSGVSGENFASRDDCSNSESFTSLRVNLQSEKSRFALGEPIKVSVVILNSGESAVSIPAVMQPENHWLKFIVSSDDGKVSSFSGPERKLKGTDKHVDLLPDYFWGTEFSDVSDYYKIDKPGEYTIQAIYGIAPAGDCPLGQYKSAVMHLQVH